MQKQHLVLIALLSALTCGPVCAEDFMTSDDPEIFESNAEVSPALPSVAKVSVDNVLKIIVYREPDLSDSFRVDDAGNIAFPLIGNVRAEGREPSEIVDEITQSLKKFIINPQITITVEKSPVTKADAVASKGSAATSITVLGEVRQSGSVEYADGMTLSKLIAQSGGFAPTADTGGIKVIRQVEGRQQLTVFSMPKIEGGEVDDPILQPSDRVVIPKQEKDSNSVAILGEVKSSGMYEVTPGITLMRVVAKAGGFMPTAATNKIRVVRRVGTEKKVFVYNAAVIISGQSDDPDVEPGDMIFVPETFF